MNAGKEKHIEETIASVGKKFKNDSKIIEYEKSLSKFKEMVQQGVVKERGNNLSSITDKTNNFVAFNSKLRTVS